MTKAVTVREVAVAGKAPRERGIYDHQCPLCLRHIRWALTHCALCPLPKGKRNGAWEGTAAL